MAKRKRENNEKDFNLVPFCSDNDFAGLWFPVSVDDGVGRRVRGRITSAAAAVRVNVALLARAGVGGVPVGAAHDFSVWFVLDYKNKTNLIPRIMIYM